MKVTVFGGAGFLGSHVADALSARKHQVLIFDRIKSAYLQKSQKMMVGNILDLKAVKSAAKDADVIYNFTAVADIEEACQKPLETAEVNILGNINILESIKSKKIKRFVYSSSIYVYSDTGSFYRSSKQASELFIEDYHKAYGIDYTILRYGSLYGPRADEKNWVYRALKQALLEKKIIRHGDGEEIREYIHVLDAAKLSVDILSKEYKNRCLIVTGKEQMRIKDMMTMMQEILKGKVKLKFLPARNHSHYEITPYVFNPRLATKIHGKEHLDMGQGMLNILDEIYQKHVLPKSHR